MNHPRQRLVVVHLSAELVTALNQFAGRVGQPFEELIEEALTAFVLRGTTAGHADTVAGFEAGPRRHDFAAVPPA